MEFTKEIHDNLLLRIELINKLCDNLNSRMEDLNKMQEMTATILNNIIADQKLYKEKIIALADNNIMIADNIPKVIDPYIKIIQALMEDYIIQISTLTGKPKSDVLKQLTDKIGIPSNQLFIIK